MSGKSGQSLSSTKLTASQQALTHFFPNREWLKVNFITPDDVDKAVAAIMQQYSFISKSDALRLNICRALGEVSMVYLNSSGGGRLHQYLCFLRRKYDKTERELPY